MDVSSTQRGKVLRQVNEHLRAPLKGNHGPSNCEQGSGDGEDDQAKTITTVGAFALQGYNGYV